MSGIDEVWKEKQAEEAFKKELNEAELPEQNSWWKRVKLWFKNLF